MTVPTWRGDVAREVDLVEEVGRHHGLGRIPSTLPPARRVDGLRPRQVRERALREVLVGAGLTEVDHYAFVSADRGRGGRAVPLQNPLAGGAGRAARRSLVLPGPARRRCSRTCARAAATCALFEIGRCSRRRRGRCREEQRLGLLLARRGRAAALVAQGPRRRLLRREGRSWSARCRRSGPATWRSPRRPARPASRTVRRRARWPAGRGLAGRAASGPARRRWACATEVVIAELATRATARGAPGPGRAHARAGRVSRRSRATSRSSRPEVPRGRAARRGAGGGGAAAAGRWRSPTATRARRCPPGG